MFTTETDKLDGRPVHPEFSLSIATLFAAFDAVTHPPTP